MVHSTQGVAVFGPLIIGLPATLITILIHGLAGVAIVHFVRYHRRLGYAGVRFLIDLGIVTGVTVLALTAHFAEMLIWAVVFTYCGQFAHLGAAFYHSAMNYTTLGYGDVVMSSSWKLLGPLEAADGVLMFGVSTAIIFAVIQLLVQLRFQDEKP